MANIIKVRARGFQSLYDVEADFTAGLNVITGPSDSGKTALGMRLLKWVALGEPSGDRVRYKVLAADKVTVIEEGPEVFAEITLDTGVVITKTRKKNGETFYTISTIAEPFKTANPPLEIQEALGIKYYNYGEDFKTALNFAWQLEAPFIISEASSVGAKILGKLAGTETVDLAIKSVSKDKYKAQELKRTAEADVEEKTAALHEYDDLENLKEQLAACEYILGEIDKTLSRKDKVKDLEFSYISAVSVLTRCLETLDRLSNLPELEQDLANIEKAQARYDKLAYLFWRYGLLADQIRAWDDQILAYWGLGDACEGISTLEVNIERLTGLQRLQWLHKDYTESVELAETVLAKTRDLDVAEAEVLQVEKRLVTLTGLTVLRHEYNVAQEAVERCERVLADVKGVEEAGNLLPGIQERYERLDTLQLLQARYAIKDRTYRDACGKEVVTGAELGAARQELAEAWNGIEVCPLCDNPVERRG